MKLDHIFMCSMLMICCVVNNRVVAEEDDDLFDDLDTDTGADLAYAPPTPVKTPQKQLAVKSRPSINKVPTRAQVETTTRDMDQLWDEIWASGRSNVSWPKDEYGFSKQVDVERLREKDIKFLNDVYHHKYAHKIDRYETQLEKDWEAAKKSLEARLKYTYELIKDPYQDAKETAEALVTMYKKDFNKAYRGAQHKLMDYIQPLVQWVKEDANASHADSKESAKTKIEAVALIQKTLEKSVADSKANVADNVMRNINKKREMDAKSVVYDVDRTAGVRTDQRLPAKQQKSNVQPSEHGDGDGDNDGKAERADDGSDHDHSDQDLIVMAAAPTSPDAKVATIAKQSNQQTRQK